MEFTVKFNDCTIDEIRHRIITEIKLFAEFARVAQKDNNIDEADNCYNIACNYVWSAHAFDIISLQTAFELIEQIAQHRHKN